MYSPDTSSFRCRLSGIVFPLAAALSTACPTVQSPAAEMGNARVLEPESPGIEAEPSAANGEEDNGGVDAGPEDLFFELRLGQKVPLETDPFAEFFEALDQTQIKGSDRLVRVLHYGDSHTAADVLTTAIRRALQTRFGDGGRGFVYLGKPWRSYRPIDVETEARGEWETRRILVGRDPTTLDGRYGLGGVAVDAPKFGGTTSVGTSKKPPFGQQASTLEVFYLKQPGGGRFDIRVDNGRKRSVKTESSHLGTGFFRAEVKNGRHTLEVRVPSKQKVRLFGAVLESKGPGVVYDTLGINGAFFYTSLRWDEALSAEQIERRAPDLMVTMYGANETDAKHLTAASYREDVRQAMSRLLSPAKEASCLMLGPMDRRGPKAGETDPSQSRVDLIIEVQRQVADEIGCAFMDLKEMMGGEGANERWQEKGLAQRDGIHLTIPGYRILGELIAERILDAYDRYVQSPSETDTEGAPRSDP